ncbi:hypothetical protein HUS70_16000 [Pandoraea nosoerga]|uniref:Uncharacterized protein n=1 Tax=Pandoraea nosoerga TaxID=2508296 RepID=A0A5E4VUA2_9BURK|nr:MULTISPECIES: hypothetical protein [Pandoraea]MBN4666763.1 hypothetical protein [Pandoraea nosoerga]MBN4677865.1 hypothetical protein [Pandoraea nosoerga]MBN4683040.1 hypothetical protein [Pandoraea nosoerga]MBN4746122.1 hypothetical protein [Pandoraea nosoerga]VVE14864.1 hypothetical protein PNO31109_02821 [Pandoraea nosoerga]
MIVGNGTKAGAGGDWGGLDIPKSLAREGHVVWFYQHRRYLGLEWDESAGEIKKAHVADSENAIYFDSFAHAVVASDRLTSPSLVLYSPGRGMPVKVMG